MTKLQDFLNSPISHVIPRLNRNPKDGDLWGLELECEGRNVDYLEGGEESRKDILLDWAPHRDGSLRDHHGSACEWVFNGPVTYKQAVERVEKLFSFFEKNRARLVTSNRTSTHVHFNMGDKNVYQLVNMFILFTILEDILDNYCGEDRNGNLFCLSSRHAEEQVNWMSDCCFRHHELSFREDWRYCSFNMAALNKFCTVEFRGMRGLDNQKDVIEWLEILNRFCEYACYKMRNPVDIVEKISQHGARGFLYDIFGLDNTNKLVCGLTDNQVHSSIYDGVRLVQMICYKIGTEFDQVKLRGKDFWASFGGERPVERDVEPDLADGLARKQPRGRVVAAPPRGAVINQWLNADAVAVEQAIQALGRAQRDARQNPFFRVAPDAPRFGAGNPPNEDRQGEE